MRRRELLALLGSTSAGCATGSDSTPAATLADTPKRPSAGVPTDAPTGETTETNTPTPGERPTPPPEDADWQWQLQGEIDTGFDVGIYDIDGFDVPRSTIGALKRDGRYLIAYFSAGTWEEWRPDADAFPASVKRHPLGDWPGERWLDITDLDVLRPIMEERARLAKAKEFDAIEWDNVDVYDNDDEHTGVKATYDDQLAYDRLLARIAHDHGLGAVLKNDPGQVDELEPAFDGCLAEEAYEQRQVGDYLPFREAGK